MECHYKIKWQGIVPYPTIIPLYEILHNEKLNLKISP